MCLQSENKWGSFGKAVAVKQNDALTFLLMLKQQSRKTLTVRVMNSLMPAVKDICLSIISKKLIKTQLQVLSFIIIKSIVHAQYFITDFLNTSSSPKNQ